MKKSLLMLIAVLMMVMLCCAACGGETAAPAEEAPAEEAAALTVEEGVLNMVTEATFPPYEYYEGDKIVGIDVEIAQLIADKLGLELVVTDIAFDSIIPSVQNGRADIGVAGLTVDEERLKEVNFSTSYATGMQVVIVKEDSPITDVSDLFDVGGYTIGAQTGTTGELYATWDLEDAGLGTVERFNKFPDAVQALIAGKIDCVIVDNEPAKKYVEANEGLKILDTEYVMEDYAIAISKDNDALLEAVDGALQELIEDGSVKAIIDKYINE